LLTLSLIALAVGIVQHSGLIEYDGIMGEYAWGAPFLIGVGAFTLIVACLGYCGAKSKRARCLLFLYFIALLMLFCLLVGTVATVASIGDKEDMKAYAERKCSVTPRPQWCGPEDQFDEVVNSMVNHFTGLMYGAAVAGIILFFNICAAYKTAANSDEKEVMACCDGVAKRWLKVTDSFLVIVSLIVLAMGSYAIYEKNQTGEEGAVSMYGWAAPFLIVVGAFTLVLSICGFVGAKTSKARALLFPYFVALLALFGLLVAVVAAIHALEEPGRIQTYIDQQCNVEHQPKWCGNVDLVDVAISHMDKIKYGTAVAGAVVATNLCAAFLTASKANLKKPVEQKPVVGHDAAGKV
jgi:energy-coupling factor transporter transmembrane protein EcfT